MLLFLLPHYIHEGKSYLTVAFGCTGGQHRSVMIAERDRQTSKRRRLSGKNCAPGYAEIRQGMEF